MNYIWSVMKGKLWNKRMPALLLLLFYVVHLYMKPLLNFADAMDYDTSPWSFPFLVSNIYFLFLLALGVTYMFSDEPFMQSAGMFQMMRTGRRKWATGQIAGICFQSFFLMGYLFVASVFWVLRRCEWTLEWGKLLHTVAMTEVSSYYEFYFDYPYESMSGFTPLQMTGLTFLLGGLVISFIGLLMFAISLLLNRTVAVVVGVAAAVMIYVVENASAHFLLALSKISPFNWMRAAYIGVYQYGARLMPPLTYIFMVLVIGLVCLCALVLWKIQTIEFQWTNEE